MDLKLTYTKNPFEFAAELRTITQLFTNLKIDVNFILQFFYWWAFNDTMREQFVHITNSNKPTLAEIEEHLFVAIERYQVAVRKVDRKNDSCQGFRKTTNFATNVSTVPNKRTDSQRKCSLCAGDHNYYQCNVYKSAAEKVKQIRILGNCEKCALSNHKTADCRMNKLKCKICGGPHFPSICPKSINKEAKGSNSRMEKSVNRVIWTSQSASMTSGNDIVLPTATSEVGEFTVRMLRDTGAQMNFVAESLCSRCDFKVIEKDLPLTVNGFNSEKKYRTKLVEIPVRFTNKPVTIKAVVVPNINIDIELPKLGPVIAKLKECGFVLADNYLTNFCKKLNNIEIVIGSESSSILPVATKVIGNPDSSSAILDTPYGVMLEGSLRKLYDSLGHVVPNKSGEDCVVHKAVKDFSNPSNLIETYDKNCASFISTFYQEGEGCISDNLIEKAGDEILNSSFSKYLHKEDPCDENEVALNERLTKFVLSRAKRASDGRLEMPILWNSAVSHCLGNNYNLARQALMSNLKKLKKTPHHLKMTNDVFVEQEQLGIIERIPNLDQFLKEHPSHSFLPHMSVFRPDHDSTKCRVVYLSNLSEKRKDGKASLCHNQAMHPGPNLNSKLIVALLLLRFDRKVFIFDLKKAFLNIHLGEVDQCKLLLLWFKDVTTQNFDLVAFKSKRLPFGISCSPAI